MADDNTNVDIDLENELDETEFDEAELGDMDETEEEDLTPSGPINPLLAIMNSGKYDLDTIPDNPALLPKNTYVCEIAEIKQNPPSEWNPRHAIRVSFKVTEGSQIFKRVSKNHYIPNEKLDMEETVDENTGEKISIMSERGNELAAGLRQLYNRLGIPRAEWANVDLSDYEGRACNIGVDKFKDKEGVERNSVRWFSLIKG